jgi:hypothetical protein
MVVNVSLWQSSGSFICRGRRGGRVRSGEKDEDVNWLDVIKGTLDPSLNNEILREQCSKPISCGGSGSDLIPRL